MITIEFSQSRSIYYQNILNLCRKFESYSFEQSNMVFLSVKEIFERWDQFNDLFWTILDWKGTALHVDGMKYYSHADKTKIFYSLQSAHNNWMNFTAYKLENLDKVYTGQKMMVEIEGEYLTDDQVNCMIESYAMKKAGY